MILVLAGTIEGRRAALALQENGCPLLASVTSPYGRDLMLQCGVKRVRQGELELPAMLSLLREGGFEMIVDATHPYAATVSRYAMEASRVLGIAYLRLERPAGTLPRDDLLRCIDSLEQLPRFLYPGCRMMSTVGSKNLPRLLELSAASRAELIARFLPSSGVMQSCEELGLPPEHIIAMKGPFSVEMNRALFKKYRIDVVLSKESGTEGGFAEKHQAARELSIPMVVWTRPRLDYPMVFNSVAALLSHIKQVKGCSS